MNDQVSPQLAERLIQAGYPVQDPRIADLVANVPKAFLVPVSSFLGRWFKRTMIEIRLVREGDLWIAALVGAQSGQRFKCFPGETFQEALGLLMEFLLKNNANI